MQSNEELIRRAFDALQAGDAEGFLQFYGEDVVLHYPGRGPLSGEYRGKDQVRALLQRQSELLGDTSPDVEIHDVLANDTHAVALQTFRAERGGRTLEDHSVLVFHIRDGQAADIWIHPQDQYAQDDFWT